MLFPPKVVELYQKKENRSSFYYFSRAFRHAAVYGLTIMLRKSILLLPIAWGREIGAFVGLLAFYLLGNERRKSLKNLELVYGNSMAPSQRLALSRKVFQNAGRSAAELAYLYAGRGGNILAQASVKGLEHVLEVLKTGRGVVILSGHYGNWELLSPLFVKNLPCELAAVARDMKNPSVDRLVSEFRTRMGLKVFLRGQTGRGYVRFLRAGNALLILGDIDTKRGDGLFVDFFGRPAWTQRGIAQLAQIGNARIVPAFVVRDPKNLGRHVLEIHPALPEPRTNDREQWVAEMTQAFTVAIEEAVANRPDLWMWMHRRWRHQPHKPPRLKTSGKKKLNGMVIKRDAI